MIGYADQAQGSNRTFYAHYRSNGGGNGALRLPDERRPRLGQLGARNSARCPATSRRRSAEPQHWRSPAARQAWPGPLRVDRYLGGVQQPVSSPDRGAVDRALVPPLVPSLLVMASAALLLSGCASAGDITARVAPTAQPGSSTDSDGPGGAMAAPNVPPVPATSSSRPRQRGYLDALAAAGVRRSTDLMALVDRLVRLPGACGRSERPGGVGLRRSHWCAATSSTSTSPAPATSAAPGEVGQDATAQYIRIATERLC